ncbi:hypothetical protein D3C72_1470010 [compost metagenome]
MAGVAAVGVDDDLAAGQAGVALGAADDEAARGVDEVLGVHQQLLRHHRGDHLLHDVAGHLLVGDVGGVLGRDDDGVDAHGAIALVLHRHLGLAVGTQVIEAQALAGLGQPAGQLMGQHDRQGHQLGRLVAGEAEHQALVAGADRLDRRVGVGVGAHFQAHVDGGGNLGRLLVDGRQHGAGLGVEAELGAGVADLLDGVAHQSGDVHVAAGGDLTGHQGHAGRHAGLAGDAGLGILRQDGVEDGVRNLVADLVGVSLGDGLRGEEVSALRKLAHRGFLHPAWQTKRLPA